MKIIVTKALLFLMIVHFTGLSLFSRKPIAEENRSWPNCPAIQAEAALVMDLNTGTVLVETNGTSKAYPASITKIMTALVALEHAKDLDEKVFFPRKAIETGDKDSSSIGILPGEELTLRDCLYALMLASANEVANAISIHIGGSMEEFVEMMNKKAEELGCVNTHFNNPSGLHDPEHYTCALDMATIGREAIKYDEFKKIAGSRTYVIPETNRMKEKRPIANYHQMINPAKYPKFAYEYCYAGKTGYTSEAGMTLVSFAKKGTMNLVCVVLKAETKEAQFGGTAKFFDYCFKRFRMEQAEKIKLNYENSDIYTDLKEKDPLVKFYTPTTAMIVIPKKCDISKIDHEIRYESLEIVGKGENEVGSVTYQYNGKAIGSYRLLYFSEEEYQLQEEEGEIQAVEVLPKKEEKELKKGELLFYKISIGVGGGLILFSLLGSLLYFRRKKRRNRYYIHKSLRRRSKRRNRLW